MYKSPIEIYETAVQTITEHRENAIFAKVQEAFDVQVDKEELVRALKYDRNQYGKGYADGKADAMASIVRCKDCKWCDDFDVNGIGLCWENERYVHGDDFCSDGERREGE